MLALVSFFGNGFAPIRAILYDSDALYPSALYRDFVRGADLSQWILSTNGYWFPDYPQYFLLRYLTGSLQVTTMAYAVLDVLLLTLSLIALARQIIPRFNAAHLALLVSLSTFFIVAHPLWMVSAGMFFGVIHHGAVVIALALTLALALRLTLRPSARKTWILAGAALAAVSLLMTASDLLYAIQVLLPLPLALLVPFIWLPASRRRIVGVLLLTAASATTGFIIDRMLRRGADNVMGLLAPAQARASFAALVTVLVTEARDHPAHVLMLALLLALALIVLLWQAWQLARHPERARAPLAVFAAFCLAQLLTSTVFVIATGIAQDIWSLRYFMPLLVLSTGCGFLFLAAPLHGSGSWPRVAMTALTLGILVTALIPFAAKDSSFDGLAQEANYYPPEVACLDTQLSANHVNLGVATYWEARHITELSRANITLAQVNSDLTPFHVLNSLESYRIEPQFILLENHPGVSADFRIDEAAVRQRFGSPAAVVDCGGSVALVYGRPADTTLRNLFAGVFAVR